MGTFFVSLEYLVRWYVSLVRVLAMKAAKALRDTTGDHMVFSVPRLDRLGEALRELLLFRTMV